MVPVGLRTVLVLLAAGIVIAAALALTPRYDPQPIGTSFLTRMVKRAPTPGSEAALKEEIAATQIGRPNYSRMGGPLADATRQELPEAQKQLARVGPLQSVAYVGGISRTDFYRVNFTRGSQLWAIALGPDGTIQTFGVFDPSPPTPQQWIDNYASFPWSQRAIRMAEQFGILLAAALFGRLAFRLRL